jgi:hypothetical protein
MRALDTGNGPTELVLSADELNTLIHEHPDLVQFRDRLHVSIKNDQLSGQLSYPLDSFGFPGHYFNGEGEFSVKMDRGILEVSALSLKVRGVEVPQQFLKGINEKNLAAKLYENPKSLALMKKIERVKVGDGKLVIQRR